VNDGSHRLIEDLSAGTRQ